MASKRKKCRANCAKTFRFEEDLRRAPCVTWCNDQRPAKTLIPVSIFDYIWEQEGVIPPPHIPFGPWSQYHKAHVEWLRENNPDADVYTPPPIVIDDFDNDDGEDDEGGVDFLMIGGVAIVVLLFIWYIIKK